MKPIISVIIPAYERPEALRRCLMALEAQQLAQDLFEVIVVDDGSAACLADELQDRTGIRNLTFLRQPNAGPATARNRGAAAARAPLLAFTDDDCLPRPDWLAALLTAASAAPDCLLGGITLNALPEDVFAEASQDIVDHVQAYHQRRHGTPVLLTSNNLSIAKDAFVASGGFDPSFPMAAGEDRDFCERWLRRGKPLRLVPDAVVDHAHAMSLRRFWRQQCNYGKGGHHAARTARRSGAAPLRVEPLGFLGGLMLHSLRTKAKGQVLRRCALMALSQVAVATGYAQDRFRMRKEPAEP